jgi:hypothetical protein
MVIKGRLKPEKESYYQQQIQNAFPDNFFESPPEITLAMTNAETDRHVAATAIISQTQYIVTFNLKEYTPTTAVKYRLIGELQREHAKQQRPTPARNRGTSRSTDRISQAR